MFAHADQPIWASGFKFVDWGTAHQHDLDEAGVPLIEMRKQIEGTDTYMAPEVARGGWQRRGGVCLRWGTRRGARPVGRKRWVGDTRPRSRHLSPGSSRRTPNPTPHRATQVLSCENASSPGFNPFVSGERGPGPARRLFCSNAIATLTRPLAPSRCLRKTPP
eukprot:1683777-Prymnesium_polylepis.2